MRKKIFLLGALIFIIFFLFSCKKNNLNDNQSENVSATKIIFGYIFNANDFSPAEGIKITEKQTGESVSSDHNGFYELKLETNSNQKYILEFSGEDFEKETIIIKNNKKERQRADLFLIPVLRGNVFYVSPSGDNKNDGSKNFPWKSIAFASSKLKAGDQLIIRKGEYIVRNFDSDIIRPKSGNSDNWILIKGENGVKIEGDDNIVTVIDLSNSSFIKLENLEITNKNKGLVRDGIEIMGNNVKNIILKNLYIHHIDEFGIDVQDINKMVLEYSRVEYCGFGAFGGPHGNFGGIRNLKILFSSLSYSGHYYQGGDGSERPYDRPDGFGIEESEGPIEIYDSVFKHNFGDGIDSKASNTYIHNCVVANNSCDGVKLWKGPGKIENTLIYGTGDGVGGDSPWAGIVIGSDRDGDSFEIVNITLHDNDERKAYPMYVQYDENARINLTVYNSIFAGGYGHLWFRDSVNLKMKYNLIYIPSRDDQVYANGRIYSKEDIKNGKLGEGNIYADPQFIKPAWGSEGNYHLKDSSPAIDKANKSKYPSEDLEHTKRPMKNGPDMGAYEKKD